MPKHEIVGVRFKKTSKVYYFDPCGMNIKIDEHVIVETARGLEYGYIVIPNKMVDESEIVLPLKPVLRIATEKDEEHYKENSEKEVEAYDICLEKIAKHGLEMKLTGAEYTFDNSKLLFYFTADGRVDFRDLVKDLASVFRTRIEMRQIGIRDEAKMMGGLGVCGRPYCCHSFMNDFVQVSIKMAKEQNLSLNSAKISGACGRLMCCLRYEYDTYLREINRMPKVDAIVETPDGDGVVVETNPLAGYLKVHLRSDPDAAAPKVYAAESIKKIKGYIKRERKEEIDEELKALEKE
ncbi:MAG: stage 0 sporulation protein [Ruminococcaceae bacterium]|nr:stage 0 sporulation protein [Oscillospiraceae bacterium]